MGAAVIASTVIVVTCNAMFISGLVIALVKCRPSEALGISLLASAGYMTLRLIDSIVALFVSECPISQYIFLMGLPLSGYYHLAFNTCTWILGTARDVFGFGQRTTFVPETTARASGLSRIALAYRIRRAFLLACRAVVFGDVPWGSFWLGWQETRWTPNGFDGLDYWRAPCADPPAEESGAVTRPVEAVAGSREARSFLVRASYVAVALTAACAGRTSSVATPPGGPAVASASAPTLRRGDARLGTWVWRKETVLNAKERQRLLDFAKEKGVTELYIAIADEYEASEGLAALAELVRGARQLDIEIVWVCGDPSWALSARHARALAVVERANRINALLRNMALPEIRSLQYDIEPYRLPEWKASPAIVEPQYAALLVELRRATKAAGFELWLDVPFWLGQRTVQGTSLGRLAVGGE
jgi:hypothetical protein